MPLSDQERRMFDEIEQGMTQRPRPGLAALLRRPRRVMRSRAAWALAFVCGVALLAWGVETNSAVGTVAGIIGYLLVVFALRQSAIAVLGRRRHGPHGS